MKKSKSLFILMYLLFVTISASAKTITVTSGADNGIGSLREAITNAAANDTIVFANDVTTVYFAGVIELNKNITINGNKTNNTIIQNGSTWTGAGKKRYFEIFSNATVNINHFTLKDNTANCGGGAIENKGNLTINNCIFSNNRPIDVGGAIHNSSGGILIIDSCTFRNNYAPSGGGAIGNNGELHITNSLFDSNNGGLEAGAIMTGGFFSSTISNCTFNNNTAKYGGAITNTGSNLNINKCHFIENTATTTSGAIYNSWLSISMYQLILSYGAQYATPNPNGHGCNITLSNSVFSKNKSNGKGIFTNDYNAIATITNCLFDNNEINNPNSDTYYPDALHHGVVSNLNFEYYHTNTKLIIVNSTIADNIGTGLYTNGEVMLYNNIIWGNKQEEIKNDVFANDGVVITQYANNLIDTSNTNLSDNNNLININPLFVGNGDYNLQEISPAIDNGNNDYLNAIDTDLSANPRISNNTVDMGAYEYQPIISQVKTITPASAEKEILKEEYFGIDGKRAKDISPLRIKRTIYTDGTVKVEKVLR
ncbi:MAG: hypothetical protein LBN27_00435 [Prevotellaceae bacterium]|jgi:hypothetical protein|nr:hypothetical protein [Prevotellaceae bacterium]